MPTDEEFYEILEQIVSEMSAAEILAYGDVYSTLAEALNNDVIDRWEEENGDDEEDEE